GLERYVSHQIYYSLQARDAEYELLPAAIDQGLGVLVWSPLAGGLLSGKYRRRRAAPKGARPPRTGQETPGRATGAPYAVLEVLVEIAEGRGVSPSQVAIAWLLGRPAVSTVIIGARTEEQLADNLAAADLRLTQADRRRLDDVSSLPLIYPYWHQALSAADRLPPPAPSVPAPYVGKPLPGCLAARG